MNYLNNNWKLLVIRCLYFFGIISPPSLYAVDPSAILMGTTQFKALANSDTFISIPYLAPTEYVGTVDSFSNSEVIVSGSPGWANDGFVYDKDIEPKTYALWIRSGNLEGQYYTIKKNYWNKIVVDLNGGSIAGLKTGDQIAIVPYHTLVSLFPVADKGTSFIESASPVVRQTEILIPNIQGNAGYSGVYYFYNNAWRQVGQDNSVNMNDIPLAPDCYFILRNKEKETLLNIKGEIYKNQISISLTSSASGYQDNPVSLIRPIPQKLNDCGLISSGAFIPSVNPVLRKDELLVFDNEIVGINKSPIATYYYNNGWKKVGSPTTVDFGNTEIFSSNYGIVIRKAKATSSTIVEWKSSFVLPKVILTFPVKGATFTEPVNIALSAIVSDSDGAVSKVEFYQGTTLIGTATTAPFNLTWNNVASGNYNIIAKVIYSNGVTATSGMVDIKVNGVNILPQVALTSPTNGTIFTAPASITLNANASDSDGTVSKVEFYQGTTLIGTATSAPFNLTWSNVAAGNYNIVAKATDNTGGSSTSGMVNIKVNMPNVLPQVALTSPTNNTTFTAPTNITLKANASDSDGTISKVEFYQGTTLIGTATSAPFNLTWSNVAAGNYNIVAKATDNTGGSSTSGMVNIKVNMPNVLPQVALTSPTNNTTFTAPANITLKANASDSDGTVSKVEFYQGTMLIGTATSAPFNLTWNNVASGNYNIVAKATDNTGASSTSGMVNINVNVANVLPQVTLTSPKTGATFTAPANVTLSASASDSDGTVSKVEFYQGTTLIGTATSAPFNLTWNNVASGNYNITAKAIDNKGASSTSVTTNIMVNALPQVTLTSPATGANFTAPGNITLSADASDSNGAVRKVEFYQGTTKLGEALSAPYRFNWSNVAQGSYNLTAKVTDNNGATTNSSAITISVGNVYYFSFKSGNDQQNDGKTIDRPKKSIQAAMDLMRPGNMLLFKRGESWYMPSLADSFNMSNKKGIPSAPITIDAYGDENDPIPVIGGMANFTSGWEPAGPNLWKLPIKDYTTINRVFVNGVSKLNATLVNSSKVYPTQVHEWTFSGGILYLYSPTSPNDSNVEVLPLGRRSATILMKNTEYVTVKNMNLRGGSKYHCVQVDSPSKHITFDHCTIGACVYSGICADDSWSTDPQNCVADMLISNCLIDKVWAEYESLQSGSCDGDGIFLYSADRGIVRGNKVINFGHAGIALEGYGAGKHGVTNCLVEMNDVSAGASGYLHAFNLDGAEGLCSNNIVRRNYFHDFTSTCHFLGTYNSVYSNIFARIRLCTINGHQKQPNGGDCAPWFKSNDKQYMTAHDNTIANNTFIDCDGLVITVGNVSGSPTPTDNIKIFNNVFDKWHILGESPTNPNDIAVNIGSSAQKVFLKNNCFWDSKPAAAIALYKGQLCTASVLNNNSKTKPYCSDNIQLAPIYVDASSDDFSPTKNSPCVSGGAVLTEMDNGFCDYFGKPWDPSSPSIGAIQYSPIQKP